MTTDGRNSSGSSPDSFRRQAERAEGHLLAGLRKDEKEWKATMAALVATAVANRQPDTADFHSAAWDDEVWQRVGKVQPPAFSRLTRIGTARTTQRIGDGSIITPFPAVVPIIGGRSLLLLADASTLDAANRNVQSILLRLLGSTRPGKLRLTLIDPGGHGQNFAALTGFPDLIRGDKILHERGEIEEELQGLIQGMSNVIQRYLGSEFRDILEYNRHAGEIEEPFRVVAVASLPEAFPQSVWEKLLSLAKNGPRAGFYVIATWDRSKEPSTRIDYRDLARNATNIELAPGYATYVPPDGPANVTIMLDAPPRPSVVHALQEYVADRARDADVVQFPFARLVEGEAWTATVPTGDNEVLSVPLGRTGARGTLDFVVQTGTMHHALIAGQTGAGKSMLLHSLILSLARRYHPRDVEFYLIDLKNGLEFAGYKRLPHARVVAIQSEREFALSVLRGIAAQMNARGDLFRQQDVHSLKEWRRDRGREVLPFIFLVVDEFESLFERHDRVATESRMLLDALARQGRAYGIHIVLCSATLSSEDLEPSTVSQLVIRIALQLSTSDSHRVLAPDNEEAALLTRPGEAIYNDDAGHPTRNRRFQAPYLPKAEQELRIEELSGLARQHGWERTPLVFDGTTEALLESNDALVHSLRQGPHERVRAIRLFLGEPMSVQEGHTEARLRRQNRSNLVLVGGSEETAMAGLGVLCVSAWAMAPRGSVCISVLDMTNVDSPVFETLDALRSLGEGIAFHRINERKIEPTIEAHGVELQRRLGLENAGPEPAWILAIHGLQRARPLQKEGSMAGPALKTLVKILRDGPDVGLHVLVSADSYASLLRSFDVRDLEEFELRVALAGGDSGRLLGEHAPMGAQLRSNFGLAYSLEKPSEVQKFKCYSLRSLQALLGA
jgi:DNA segregation ATPase FtsK/SpoIIIE, S-DNA-T family